MERLIFDGRTLVDTMRRRRFLALAAAVTGVAGCTGESYQPAGPRTPPPAPPTERATAPTLDAVESRAQAVVRPLNEAYRIFRDPLVTLDVAAVARTDLQTAEAAVETARESVTAFSTGADVPARYRSLPSLVTAHELLVDALTAAVDLAASLSRLDSERVDDPAVRLEPLRSQAVRLERVGTEVQELVASDPAVPDALFLTTDRMRSFATTLGRQSTAVGRLLDASLAALDGALAWRRGVAAFERHAFSAAESAFTTARTRYRAASDTLADSRGADGSFAEAVARRSCSVEAALDAVPTALDAAVLGGNGDVARATERLRTAQTTRNRCVNG